MSLMKETPLTQTLSSLTPRKVNGGFHWTHTRTELNEMNAKQKEVPQETEGGGLCPKCGLPFYHNNISTRAVIVSRHKKNRWECDFCGHIWPVGD